MISPGSGARGGAAPENKKQYSFADESQISTQLDNILSWESADTNAGDAYWFDRWELLFCPVTVVVIVGFSSIYICFVPKSFTLLI